MKPQPDPKSSAPSKATAETEAIEPAPSVLLKLAIELGPLLVFFGTNAAAGIYAGTAAFIAATIVSLVDCPRRIL
jgi:intracellular septation protein